MLWFKTPTLAWKRKLYERDDGVMLDLERSAKRVKFWTMHSIYLINLWTHTQDTKEACLSA